MPTSTKPRAWKLSKLLNNGCNGFSSGVHCVEEGDHIPPLHGYGQVLKQKDCFSGIISIIIIITAEFKWYVLDSVLAIIMAQPTPFNSVQTVHVKAWR